MSNSIQMYLYNSFENEKKHLQESIKNTFILSSKCVVAFYIPMAVHKF